ncbi:MAG TPA: cytochrome c [Acidimicrobiales bacterium]|nr:cytochrome c [Acidimicrobiales bacterium]
MSRPRAAIIGLAVLVSSVVACAASGDSPAPSGDQATDPVLTLGRAVYQDHCARCHGKSGGGGAGPKLANGTVARDFPNPDDQAALIRTGRGAMPSWGGTLSDDEITAVVRYTREVL